MISELCENLLNGRWQQLLDVKRFQTHHIIDPLTVADHSWLTAMLSMIIFDTIFKHEMKHEMSDMRDHISLMRNELLSKALLHDIEESLTGDIPLDDITKSVMKKVKKEVASPILQILFPADLFTSYSFYHLDAKNPTVVSGIIIKYADMLSALVEALREKKLGNTNFDDIIQNAMSLLNDICNDIECGNRDLLIKTVNFLIDLNKDIHNYVAMMHGIRIKNMV